MFKFIHAADVHLDKRRQTPPLSNLHPLGTLAAYRDLNIEVNPLQVSVGMLMFTDTMVRAKKSAPAVFG